MRQHPEHYSSLAKFGSGLVSTTQERWGAGVYFNPYVIQNGVQIKYGVTSIDNLCTDLSSWNNLYLAGRLQKPVKILRDHPRVRLANQANLISAVRTALLLLPPQFTENELYSTIAGLSYLGDPRMALPTESPSKVTDIVTHNMTSFRKLYGPLLATLPNVDFTATTPDNADPDANAKLSQDMDPTKRANMGRSLRRTRYTEADSDEDKLSDDEFEAKLADEIADDHVKESSPELTPEEADFKRIVDAAKLEISRKKLGNPLMQLRLVANSPHNFFNPWGLENGPEIDERIVTASGKMLLLDRLLPALLKRGHKVLIFSQFKTQLDILHDYCTFRKLKICRIDGSVSQAERQEHIDAFNSDPDFKVFLLSTRAGGQGINLTAADTVILFDSDWNPRYISLIRSLK
ncbi:hypothetical protein BN1723_005447, partial [Verticillium longisporum]